MESKFSRRISGFEILINPVQEKDLYELEPFIRNWELLPYEHYKEVTRDRAAVYLLSQLREAILDPSNALLYQAQADRQATGLICVRMLNWDSRIFGLKMAKIDPMVLKGTGSLSRESGALLLERILRHCEAEGISHLSTRVDTKDILSIHLLEDQGFRLVDTLVTYLHNLRDFTRDDLEPDHLVRPFQPSDFAPMKDLARKAFSNKGDMLSRFYADPHLPDEKCDEFYGVWLENSVQRNEADKVFVAELDQTPVGFITCKINPGIHHLLGVKIGYTPLTAVLPEVRKQGVYTSLKKAAMGWLKDRVDFLESRTPISNITSQRIWVKLGGKLVSSHYTFHKWLDKS